MTIFYAIIALEMYLRSQRGLVAVLSVAAESQAGHSFSAASSPSALSPENIIIKSNF